MVGVTVKREMSQATRASVSNDETETCFYHSHTCTVTLHAISLTVTINTVYADDWGIDTETQTTDWNAGNFPNLKYPLPLSENVTTPLYNINTRDKRQTSPTGTYICIRTLHFTLTTHCVKLTFYVMLISGHGSFEPLYSPYLVMC